AQQGAMVPRRGADEVLQAVSLLVMAVGDRLVVLPLEVRGEPGQGGPGVGALLAAGPGRDGRPGGPNEAVPGPVEDLPGDAALLEQLLLAKPVTPVHRPPPARAALAGRLFYITP